jgi:hypothetical protein
MQGGSDLESLTISVERKWRCFRSQQISVFLVVACTFLLSGTSCVDLSKPPNVEGCARAGTCADDSSRHTDAATDGKPNADEITVVDLPPGGKADGADVPSDVLTLDDAPDASAGGNTGDAADGALDDDSRRDMVADEKSSVTDVPAEQQSPEVAMADLDGEFGPDPAPEPPTEPGATAATRAPAIASPKSSPTVEPCVDPTLPASACPLVKGWRVCCGTGEPSNRLHLLIARA